MRKFCFCLENYSIDVFYMVTRPNTTNSISFISSLNNSPALKFCSKDLKDYYDLHQNIYCQSPDFGRKCCCCCCLIRQLLLGYLRSGPSPFMFALSKRERERVRERERAKGIGCVRQSVWVGVHTATQTDIHKGYKFSFILYCFSCKGARKLNPSLSLFMVLLSTLHHNRHHPSPHSTNVCNTDARIDERLLDRQEQEENSNTFVNRNEQTYIHW